MKTLLHKALLVLLLNTLVFAQSGWVWLNPLPQGNNLNNVSYVNGSLVYVSGYGGTLMKSNNGGNNFTIIPTGIREPLKLNFINELTGFSASGAGILRTTDGGYNWQYFQLPTNYEISLIQYIYGSTLFAMKKGYTGNSYSTSLYKSTDLGQTWAQSLGPNSEDYMNCFHFPNDITGYAVGKKQVYNYYSKIYRTTNGGLSWDSVASAVKYEFRAVNFINSNTGFVTTYGLRNLILKTTNACQSWDTVNHGSFLSIKFFNSLSGYAGEGTASIALTTNSGLNWQNVYVDNKLYLNDINNGLGLLASYFQNFIYRTTNSGNNWTQITQGFYDESFDITFINESTGFAAGSSRIYKTTNGGVNWTAYELNLQGYNTVESLVFINANTGYAGIDEARIGKTTNCGVNWTIYQTGYYDHNFGISFPSLDTGYSVTKYGNYLKTTNGGVNWSTLGWRQGHYLQDVYFINNTTGFAGGDSLDFGFVRKTKDGGQTWTLTILDSIHWICDVGVSDSITWFAVGYGYNYNSYPGFIYRSTDAGLNWNYTKFPYLIGAIYFPTKLIGYASTYGNMMYKTTSGGDSWFATESICANESYGIFFTNENTGYAVGYSGQMIKTTTGGGNFIGINPISSEVPNQFILHQNYPNPFNPVTRIRFQVAGSTNIKLTIYDVIGREIATLINKQLKPGLYEVPWDGTNYPSGVYFYQLIVKPSDRLDRSDGYSVTRKMVLLK